MIFLALIYVVRKVDNLLQKPFLFSSDSLVLDAVRNDFKGVCNQINIKRKVIYW